MRELTVGDLDLAGIAPSRAYVPAPFAATAWITPLSTDRRAPTLLAMARVYEAWAQDDALDSHDTVVSP